MGWGLLETLTNIISMIRFCEHPIQLKIIPVEAQIKMYHITLTQPKE